MSTARMTQPSRGIARGRRTRLVSDGVVARYLHDISTREASPALGQAPRLAASRRGSQDDSSPDASR